MRRIFQKTCYLHSHFRALKKNIKTIYNKIDPIICYNAIIFDEIKQKQEYNQIKNKIYVGRLLTWHKGQDIIRRALGILNINFGLQFIITFVGNGPSKDALNRLSYQLKLKDSVSLLGSKPHDWV